MSYFRRDPRGQTIVVFALALTALLAMVGLVIDGGNAFAQQRRTQNAADAAAEAGAVQLARRMVGLPGSDSEWDQRVLDAVATTLTTNGITTTATPQYTNLAGDPIGNVGGGTIPADAAGVLARGNRQFSTFVAGVAGFGAFTASAEATAVTGYANGVAAGAVIPLTLPLILTQCESGGGSDRLFHPPNGDPWPTGPNNRVALPLCSNGPGNVGWIDWDPPAGGAEDVGDSIERPDGPPITTPKWYFVSETGAVRSLDDEMDTWEGKDILIPIFHVQVDDPGTPSEDESLIGTCDTDPGSDQTELDDCPDGRNGGTGSNQWYYLVTFAEFHLERSYIQNRHELECNDPALAVTASPAGATNQVNNCLIGYFKGPVVASNVTVGPGTGTSSFTPVGIQLIR